MNRVNTDGVDAKERAELETICADPKSRNRDVQAARQKLADLDRDRRRRWGG